LEVLQERYADDETEAKATNQHPKQQDNASDTSVVSVQLTKLNELEERLLSIASVAEPDDSLKEGLLNAVQEYIAFQDKQLIPTQSSTSETPDTKLGEGSYAYQPLSESISFHEGRAGIHFYQWNTLSDCSSGEDKDLGGFDNLIQPVSAWLKWKERKWRILDKLYRSKADVITLQEVDHFDDFIRPALEFAGYVCLREYKPQPVIRGSNVRDASVLAFQQKKLRLVNSMTVVLERPPTLQELEGELKEAPSNVSVKTNQVAVLARLELICTAQTTQSEQSNAQQIVVCVTHLKAGKSDEAESIRAGQMNFLLARIHQFSSAASQEATDYPIFLLGDFNSVTRLGAMESIHGEFYQSPFTPAALPKLLDSGYENVIDHLITRYQTSSTAEGQPRVRLFTTGKQRKGVYTSSTIDNIFWKAIQSKPRLVDARIALVAHPTHQRICLPHPQWPSDHLAVEAVFEFE